MSLNSKDRQINHYGELSGEINYKPDGSNKIVSIPGHQFNYRLGYKDFYLIPITKLPNNAISNNSKLLFDLDVKCASTTWRYIFYF